MYIFVVVVIPVVPPSSPGPCAVTMPGSPTSPGSPTRTLKGLPGMWHPLNLTSMEWTPFSRGMKWIVLLSEHNKSGHITPKWCLQIQKKVEFSLFGLCTTKWGYRCQAQWHSIPQKSQRGCGLWRQPHLEPRCAAPWRMLLGLPSSPSPTKDRIWSEYRCMCVCVCVPAPRGTQSVWLITPERE